MNGEVFFVRFFERFFSSNTEEELWNHFSGALKLLCFECTYNWLDERGISLGPAVEPDELKSLVGVLRELGLSYEETADVMSGVAKEVRSVRHLWKKSDNSRLIMIGLALIAFPEPIISDALGAVVLSAGIIQKRVRRFSFGIEDVYNTFQGVMRDLQTIRRGLVE